MGRMNLVPLMGEKFNYYLPILVSVVCFIVLFQLHGRLMACCGLGEFFSGSKGDANNEVDLIEGRAVLEQGKMK